MRDWCQVNLQRRGWTGEVQSWEFFGKCEWSYCHGLQLRNIPENYQGAKCHEYRCHGLFFSGSCVIYRGGKLTPLSVCVSTLIRTLCLPPNKRWTRAAKGRVILQGMGMAVCWHRSNQEMITVCRASTVVDPMCRDSRIDACLAPPLRVSGFLCVSGTLLWRICARAPREMAGGVAWLLTTCPEDNRMPRSNGPI